MLVADIAGRTRALTVGRLKIEPRELLLVRWQVPLTDDESDSLEKHAQTFFQKVDTVRLVGADGVPISATELRVGSSILGWSHAAEARHKGEIVAAAVALER